LLTENYLSTTSNYVFRKSLFDEVGPFRPLRYAHDWDFALRLAQVAKIGLIPEMLLQYRVHERNTIRENIAAMIFEICWCLSIHLSDAATSPLLSGINPSLRVDQLLNSIYTYDCDRVLSVMLLENIADDLAEALDLLDPKNPIRAKYIRYIVEQLEQRPEAEFDVAPQSRSLIARVMRRLRSV
jgi:hypothetical protein